MLEFHGDLPAPADHEKDLRTAYQALCDRHQQIDDFRGKLLALLPIASGAAALLLLRNSAAVKNYLTPIGIYGCAVTAGLFLYELYGVSVCLQVITQAGELETELQVPEGMGLFRDRRPGSWRELVGAEMASWVVYVSVFAGWLYVAGVSRRWWDHPWAKYILVTAVAAVLLLRWATIAPRERHKREAAAARLGWQGTTCRVVPGRAMYVIDRQGRIRHVSRSMTGIGHHVGDALELARRLQAGQPA